MCFVIVPMCPVSMSLLDSKSYAFVIEYLILTPSLFFGFANVNAPLVISEQETSMLIVRIDEILLF